MLTAIVKLFVIMKRGLNVVWFGNIFTTRESSNDELEEEKDWNYKYKNSGTYGQTEYTVRERSDGTKDVYIVSDSGKCHSHTLIDEDGNVIETYHEYLDYYSELMNESNIHRKVLRKY